MRTATVIKNGTPEEFEQKHGYSLDVLKNWEEVKDRVKPRLMDTRDTAFAADKPHTMVADIPVIYTVPLGMTGDEVATAIVTEGLREHWGVTVEELHEKAVDNLDGEPTPLNDIIRDIAGDEMADEVAPPVGAPPTLVVTNKDRSYGAAEILNGRLMRRLCLMFGGELAIIPSSIHECLVMPVGVMDVDDVNEMIKAVNATLDECDILSDKLYIYNPETGLRIA